MRFSPNGECCVVDPPCSRCSADTDPLAVTFTGFTDGLCNCGFLNATFLQARGCLGVGDTDCCWTISGSVPCGAYASSETLYTITTFIYDISASVVRIDTELNLTEIISGAWWTMTTTRWRIDVASAPPIDCTVTRYPLFREYHTYFGLPTRHVCLGHDATTCRLN